MLSQLNQQPGLFADTPKRLKLTREEQFQEFHRQNPAIYRILLLRALNMKRYGFTAYSMRTLWEVLRWDISRGKIKTPDKFELNNNHAPFYARLLMASRPELRGFFEVREKRPCST
jgi:hypothetical protein